MQVALLHIQASLCSFLPEMSDGIFLIDLSLSARYLASSPSLSSSSSGFKFSAETNKSKFGLKPSDCKSCYLLMSTCLNLVLRLKVGDVESTRGSFKN